MAEIKDYLQLLPEGWQRDLDAYEAKAKSLVALVIKSNAEMKAIGGTNISGASFAEVEALVKKLNTAYTQLEAATDRLTKAQAALDAARVRVKQQIDALAAANTRLAKAQAAEAVEIEKVNAKTREQVAANKAAANAATAQEGSLVALRAELKQLTTAYDALSKEQRENAAVGGVLQKQILATNTALSAAEQSTGRFGRNVGNYQGALQGFRMQFQQVARELPSLANGFSTFAMAIGNNLPIALDAYRQLVVQQAAARAEGQKTTPVWKSVIGSIFSWQTALLAVLTVLPLLPKLLSSNNKAAEEAEAANKRYADSLKSIEQSARSAAAQEESHLRTLTETAANVSLSMKVRNAAVKELQETYPSYFGNLDKEAILAGNVADATNRATAAILAKTRAQAAEKKLVATQEQLLDLSDRIIAGNENVRKSQEKFNTVSARANDGYIARANEGNAIRAASAAKDLQNKKEYRDGLIAESDKLLQAQKRYAAAIQVNTEAAGPMMLEGKGTKPEKAKKPKKEKITATPKDYTQDLAAERAKQIAIEADAQKRIIDDETQSIQKRVNAIYEFEQIMLRSVKARYDGEIQETQNSLARIVQIDATAIAKRTSADKDLLSQRGLLEAKLTRLKAEQSNEQIKISTDAYDTELKITNKFYKEYTNATEIAEKYLAELKSGNKLEKKEDRDRQIRVQRQIDIARDYAYAANELASIQSTRSQARIAEIDAESAAIERRYSKEIEGIQSSILDEEDKANRIAKLREEQYQEEQIQEEKRKQEKIKQAELNKAIAIANIILNTSLAVIGALATAPQNPLASAQAIAAGVAGAAALATALATPIPQYAEGTDNHPGGKAIVGDGGKSEYVVYPSGRIGITPAVSTLVDLPRGTMVMPDLDSLLVHYPNQIPQMQSVQQVSGEKIKDDIRQTNRLLKQLIQKPGLSIRTERDAYHDKLMHRPFGRK